MAEDEKTEKPDTGGQAGWYLFYISLAAAAAGAYYCAYLIGFEFENAASQSNQQKFQSFVFFVFFVPIWLSMFFVYLALRWVYTAVVGKQD